MKAVVLSMLRLYKRWISPSLAPSCRYVPTCSEYAMEAIERHGVVRGSAMGAWRILRCHPYVKGGYDPVVKTGTELRSMNGKQECRPHTILAND